MNQLKRAQCIMLPTKKDNISINDLVLNIFDKTELAIVTKHNIFTNETFRFGKYGITFRNSYSHNGFEHQHLYIISNDEIKEGDFILTFTHAYGWNIDQIKEVRGTTYVSVKNELLLEESIKGKIIATTDTSLKRTCNCAILCTNACDKTLPQPSQQFIIKCIEEYNKSNIITDILVEYEEIIEKLYSTGGSNDPFEYLDSIIKKEKLKINPKDNTITIKKLKDSWNREEVKRIALDAIIFRESHTDGKTFDRKLFDNWIEQNL